MILNSFIRHSDVVKVGCLAQLVNVIAPIMTVEGGPAWKQTIYYPYLYASQYGRGKALDLTIDSPCYDTNFAKNVNYLDVSAVLSDDDILTFFIVNRHQTEAIDLGINLEGFSQKTIIMDKEIEGYGLSDVNGPDGEIVEPKDGGNINIDSRTLTATIAPLSYRMIRIAK